jgi:hypothetical protein
MQDFFANIVSRHEQQVIEGKHDDECEFRANGHYLCNCAARKRKASGYTEPPGELIHRAPDCPRCYEEVEHDGDCFRCDRCSVHWPDPNGEAEFTDDHGPLDMKSWDEAKAARG